MDVEWMWSGCGVDVDWMWSKWSSSGVQVGVWGSVKYSANTKHKQASGSRASSIQETGPELSTVASSPAQTPEPSQANKKSKFEKRFDANTTSDEDILSKWKPLMSLQIVHIEHSEAKQMKSWMSNVYQHFNQPVIIREDDDVIYRFICKKYVTTLMSDVIRPLAHPDVFHFYSGDLQLVSPVLGMMIA